MMALLSPIEVYLKTRIVYELSHTWGPFSHYDSILFREKDKHAQWIESLEENIKQAKETFIEHYKNKYEGFPCLPLWMACEVMSMGGLSLMYCNLRTEIQLQICSILGIRPDVMRSWMHVITYLRNTCAHHGRLWNRELAIKPIIPNKNNQWQASGLNNRYLFSTVAVAEWICRKANLPLSKIEPVHTVMRQISTLDARFSRMMGVPDGRNIGMCWEGTR